MCTSVPDSMDACVNEHRSSELCGHQFSLQSSTSDCYESTQHAVRSTATCGGYTSQHVSLLLHHNSVDYGYTKCFVVNLVLTQHIIAAQCTA
jgi:hypothetical protein